MTTNNASVANDLGSPSNILLQFRTQVGDVHTASIHLRYLAECLDEIFQGGGGNHGHVGALITAVSEKINRLDADLEKLWDEVATCRAPTARVEVQT